MIARHRASAFLAAALAFASLAASAEEAVPLGPHDPLAGVAGERPFLRIRERKIVHVR